MLATILYFITPLTLRGALSSFVPLKIRGNEGVILKMSPWIISTFFLSRNFSCNNGIKSASFSTAITFLARFAKISVSEPKPGPISKTTSRFVSSAASAITSKIFLLLRKFCPKNFFFFTPLEIGRRRKLHRFSLLVLIKINYYMLYFYLKPHHRLCMDFPESQRDVSEARLKTLKEGSKRARRKSCAGDYASGKDGFLRGLSPHSKACVLLPNLLFRTKAYAEKGPLPVRPRKQLQIQALSQRAWSSCSPFHLSFLGYHPLCHQLQKAKRVPKNLLYFRRHSRFFSRCSIILRRFASAQALFPFRHRHIPCIRFF